MEDYNQYIAEKTLNNIHRGIIQSTPQPTMLGGKRMRKFVLPGSSEYDYPGTLSVGNRDYLQAQPQTLGGNFWKDFGHGVKTGFTESAKVALPLAKDVAVSAATGYLLHGAGAFHDDISRPIAGRRRARVGANGHGINPLGGSILNDIASVGKHIGHTALHDILIPVGTEVAKESLKSYLKGSGKPRGRPRKGAGVYKDYIQPVGRKIKQALYPIGKDLYDNVYQPLKNVAYQELMNTGKHYIKKGKDYLKKSIGGKRTNILKSITSGIKAAAPYAPLALMALGRGKGKKAGVLIRNQPNEFHDSIYPPALASYRPRGGARSEMTLPSSATKRYHARGDIVGELMRKNGMTLGQASKYVKQNDLY